MELKNPEKSLLDLRLKIKKDSWQNQLVFLKVVQLIILI